MKLKINDNYLYIFIFTSFFFLWGVDLKAIFFQLDPIKDHGSYFRLNFLIIFLIVPILINCIKEKGSLFKKIFNYQQYIIFFILFIVAHFFLIKIYYQEVVDKSEIINLIFLILLSVIYCHYRNFILVNFKKILTLYLIIFLTYSVYEGSQIYNFGFYDDNGVLQFKNFGQCNNDIFLIDILRRYLNISLSNSIYLENSHLAMMTIGVFFSSIYILTQERKKNILFLILFSIEVIIVLNNLSTTYFVGYFFSQIVLLLFFIKKIDIKFWIIAFLFLTINSYLFFSDKHCVNKITQFSIRDIQENTLDRTDAHGSVNPNLTTAIYQRSMIVAKETLINHTLGWGIDGMDNANYNLIKDYLIMDKLISQYKPTELIGKKSRPQLKNLNMKDGLSNFFKMFTEFGIFTFILFFYFLRYILNIKNINSYNVFIITLFITLCIRGAGYFNGGFIFCILEFFYYKKIIKD